MRAINEKGYQALCDLAAIIQRTGLTVNDYALHVVGCHPSQLYSLGLGGGGATPVTVERVVQP